MTRYVVDASVGAKWFLPEEHTAEAARLLRSPHELIAPDIFAAEVADSLLKRIRRKLMSVDEAVPYVIACPWLVSLRDLVPLAAPAFEVARLFGIGLYDAAYVALARQEDCEFVTADLHLYNG